VHGACEVLEVAPTVRALRLECPPPSLQTLVPTRERVFRALDAVAGPAAWTADPAAVRQLSPLARREGWRLTAFLRDKEAVGFAAAGQRPLGLAVDLGSTKIAGYLLDLETGEEVGASGIMNPQSASERTFRPPRSGVPERGGRRRARSGRAGSDRRPGRRAREQAGAAREQIADACVVGNTAMTHLYLSLPVQQLSVSPFVAAAGAACDVKARELGLAIAPVLTCTSLLRSGVSWAPTTWP